jgi:multidrug efflux pump subunit AcrA (membrane-fusion protein)
VEKILVREGDTVTLGQPLATVNAEELRLNLKSAEAALSVLGSELDQARSVLGRLPKGNPLYSRLKEVYDAGGISKAQLNQAGQGGDSSIRSQAELLVKDLEANKAKAEAKVEELKALFSKTTLNSPAAGFVAKRYIQEGQKISTADPAFLITHPDPIYLEAFVPEKETRKMKLGQNLEVLPETSKASPRKGEIIQIENQSELKNDDAAAVVDPGSNLRRIKIRIPNADGGLKPGLRASARI